MMRVDISNFEMHNIIRDGRGGLRVRKGLKSIKTPTSGTEFIGGFSVESPRTTEPWHYLIERSTTTGVATLRVFTEEYLELFSHNLGQIGPDAVVSWGVQNTQLMVNSPGFSGPLYGLAGGGLVNAIKAESENEDTTALDIPSGHIATFGDRFAIASGNLVHFNDPGIDPRAFVAENITSFPGTIYDLIQGPGGGLYVFTSAGLYVMAGDALGQGQEVSGFISRVPGIETSRPRNAAASGGLVAVLTRNSVKVIDGPEIVVNRGRLRRYWSKVVEVDDMRDAGAIFGTPRGFIVGFRGRRGFYLDIDMRTESFSWVSSTASAINVVGTLRTREGGELIVLADRVVMPIGNVDFDSTTVRGVAVGRLDIPEADRPVIRRVTVSADNANLTVGAAVNGSTDSTTTPTGSSDGVIGTATWSASTKLTGRTLRTTRLSLNVRASDPHIEIRVDGADAALEPAVEVLTAGQARGAREKSS